ncbi:hypothetical protein HJG60_009515 [Phyllostomus discolor]|uniref:Uncharacterized protein n=1 Tax=Phyllostomus discolor TaxID=89673 RepID=A0A833YIZ8_9CHIR|nr:hypothetical protein HJG60_009515 [Phyllostomus discolor]
MFSLKTLEWNSSCGGAANTLCPSLPPHIVLLKQEAHRGHSGPRTASSLCKSLHCLLARFGKDYLHQLLCPPVGRMPQSPQHRLQPSEKPPFLQEPRSSRGEVFTPIPPASTQMKRINVNLPEA